MNKQLTFDDIAPAPDKRRAVEAALKHPKAATLSNVQIARHCGVSEGFVRKIKPIFVQYEDETVKTVTRNGSTARRCAGCGRPLRSLFERCAACENLPDWLV